jgi:anaerobic ribonucleoside-triphosphate reductase activating protein
MIKILDIIEDTTVDGPGFRTTIYCAGCAHKCEKCHNPQTWDFNQGRNASTDELMKVIISDEFANVTFSGGDPMYQADGFRELAERIKSCTKKNIWCYTGFTFETLLRMPKQRALLELIDVLVDGPFVESLKDTNLLFRGSKNQRLIDVQASLREGKTVLWKRKNRMAA